MAIQLTLKKDKDFLPSQGHPWIYREAIKDNPANIPAGTEVIIHSHKGKYVGSGFADPGSPIFIRLIEGCQEEDLKQRIQNRIKEAISRREVFFTRSETDAYRLVNGEGDGLGGLILDKYGKAVVMQTYTEGWEPFINLIGTQILNKLPQIKWIYRRNQVRRAESGQGKLLKGENFPGKIDFIENGLKFQADLVSGQKTGFFLDQRENRALIRSISKGRRVGNICGYTGAFTIYALAGGAKETVTVDSAAPALRETEKHLRMNGFSIEKNALVLSDMYEYFQKEKIEKFDLLILDPPSMAKSRSDVEKALRAYQRLNLFGMKAIRSGGFLFTASCSSQVGRDDFLRVVLKSAVAAGKKARLISETHHAPDHPIVMGHMEGRYLHGLLLEISD